MTIKFEGETYRDDRMFVLNIATATDSEGKACWNLATYRNTLTLPFIRNDFFDTKKDLLKYVRKIEPYVPLISNNKKPLEIPETIDPDNHLKVWQYFNKWLIDQKLFSAVDGKTHVPYYVDKRGFREKLFHVTIEKV